MNCTSKRSGIKPDAAIKFLNKRQKMIKSNIIKSVMFFLVVFLFIGSNAEAQSESENYEMGTDVVDEFGGVGESETYFLIVGSGGQPGVIGISEGDSFYALQGYIHTAGSAHGDANGDGKTDISDAVFLILYLFRGGSAPDPVYSGDVNCDGVVTIVDVVYMINYLLRSGPPPCNS